MHKAEPRPPRVTNATLDRSPERLLTFLRGAAEPAICAKLTAVGLSVPRMDEAWALLCELRLETPPPVPLDPNRNAEAIAACESLQCTALVRARAILQLHFPEQGRLLFHDFAVEKGPAAVLNVATFIARRQVLQSGSTRKSTRKIDREALALLAEIGITNEFVATMQATAAAAQHIEEPPSTEGLDIAAAKRLETLRKIHGWITAWSEVARTVVKRRDYQIRLGIARRRPRRPAATRTYGADEPAPDSRAA